MPADGAIVTAQRFPCPTLEGDAAAAYTVHGRRPSVVLLPETEEQAAKSLAVCDGASLAVAPWGGGTLQAVGYPPEQLDVVLSTERLNQIVVYEPADLTISVQAGCTVEAMRRALAEHGQMLPFDAADPARATIGGAVAANLAGPRRFGPGSYRDLLIGVTFALPDGTIAKGGGLVVKNVSGYDLMKLHLGALGTLGLLLRLNFKVLTRPAVETTALVEGKRSVLLALADELANSNLAVDSLELLGPGVPEATDDGWRLAARLAGSARGVERKRGEVDRRVEGAGLSVTWVDGSAMEDWWRRVVAFQSPGRDTPEDVILRLVALPTELGTLLEHVEATVRAHGLEGRFAAHAGNGVLFARVAGDALNGAFPKVHARLLERWPNVVVLASPPELHAALLVWGAPPSGLALMQTIKAQFDPKGTLNAGRLFPTVEAYMGEPSEPGVGAAPRGRPTFRSQQPGVLGTTQGQARGPAPTRPAPIPDVIARLHH